MTMEGTIEKLKWNVEIFYKMFEVKFVKRLLRKSSRKKFKGKNSILQKEKEKNVLSIIRIKTFLREIVMRIIFNFVNVFE